MNSDIELFAVVFMGAIWLLPMALIVPSKRFSGVQRLLWIPVLLISSWIGLVLYTLYLTRPR